MVPFADTSLWAPLGMTQEQLREYAENALTAELERALKRYAKHLKRDNVTQPTAALQAFANAWRPKPPEPPKLSAQARALLRALQKMTPEERIAEMARLQEAAK
jgi:DNA-binding response OmpR family regulator